MSMWPYMHVCGYVRRQRLDDCCPCCTQHQQPGPFSSQWGILNVALSLLVHKFSGILAS